jgi:hypothetical protein
MAYSLRALIAQKQVLEQLIKGFKFARMIPLKDPQFSLVPLSKQFLEELDDKGLDEFPEKLSLPPALLQTIETHSHTVPIAYIQTEYFGGIGEQGAIVWHQGEILFQDIQSGVGVVNQGLSKLAVKPAENLDEFDALGLGTHRSTEAWI